MDVTREMVRVTSAVGKLLSEPLFQASGKKLLAKGRLISEEDSRLLEAEGYREVPVAVLEAHEVAEEEAAVQIASEAACGSMELRVAAGGRVNLTATEDCCLLVDEAALRVLNRSGVITAACLPGFSFAFAGQRLCTIKSAPFGVPADAVRTALELVRQNGPIFQAKPIRQPTVGVLYSDPLRADRARVLFEGIMRTRLERFGLSASFVLSCCEDEAALTRNLSHLLRSKPTLILAASTTAPAGPDDVVGQAMLKAGCRLESFLAPVEPGNLLMMAYADDVPVLAAPGCFRSPKPNVIDLILPPLLARYPLAAAEISSLGHGGLLQ